MAHLYIIRGVPGSGKSTLAKRMISTGMASRHYEADMYMVDEFGQYKFDRNKLPECHGRCYSDAIESLKAGREVIVSNTFTKRWEYQNYIIAAQDIGCFVTVLVCQGVFKNIHGVPINVVSSMRERFEY